jgi:hypothetical protein
MNIDEIIEYARKFPNAVTPDAAVIFETSYLEYRGVFRDVRLPRFAEAIAFLDEAAERMSLAQIALNDLEQVVANPTKFYPTLSVNQLTARREKIANYRRKISIAAQACAAKPDTACKDGTLENLPELVPTRAQRAQFDPRIGTPQPVGVVGEGEQKSLVFIGPVSWHGFGESSLVWPDPATTDRLEVVVQPDGQPSVTQPYRLPFKISGPSKVYMRIIDGTQAEYDDNRCRAIPGTNLCEVVLF